MPPTPPPDETSPPTHAMRLGSAPPAFAPRRDRAIVPGEAGPPLGVHVRAALQQAHAEAVDARDRARQLLRRAEEEFRAASAKLQAAADREEELRHFLRRVEPASGPVALSADEAARAMGPGSDRPIPPSDLLGRP